MYIDTSIYVSLKTTEEFSLKADPKFTEEISFVLNILQISSKLHKLPFPTPRLSGSAHH
jgi:hypothetical protein